MRKTREILNNLWPLLPWRAHSRASAETGETPQRSLDELLSERSTSTWHKQKPVSWQAVDNTQQVKAAFNQLRERLYQWNQETRKGPVSPPRAMWESGQIAGGRPYFFLQPWNEMGFLFEMTDYGWLIARAEKIASLDRFMRQLNAWDHIILYQADAMPDALRLKSDQWGDELVSLSLYEDALLRLFTELTLPESRTKRPIDT